MICKHGGHLRLLRLGALWVFHKGLHEISFLFLTLPTCSKISAPCGCCHCLRVHHYRHQFLCVRVQLKYHKKTYCQSFIQTAAFCCLWVCDELSKDCLILWCSIISSSQQIFRGKKIAICYHLVALSFFFLFFPLLFKIK